MARSGFDLTMRFNAATESKSMKLVPKTNAVPNDIKRKNANAIAIRTRVKAGRWSDGD
jgi:hypothetical protein